MTPTKEQYEKARTTASRSDLDERLSGRLYDIAIDQIAQALADEAEAARMALREKLGEARALIRVLTICPMHVEETPEEQAVDGRRCGLPSHLPYNGNFFCDAHSEQFAEGQERLATAAQAEVEAQAARDAARAEAESLRAAATRLIASATKGAAFRYTPWTEAGGGKQCTHLVNLGIECRDCDLAFLTKDVSPRQLTALAPRPNPACPSG